ncbi:hypothetical protein F5B20DRAFT_565793 [Whalleya microplaca]|nr:hypothetical protein F5B20DRAFT_565793 [Whalleya microplaca]
MRYHYGTIPTGTSANTTRDDFIMEVEDTNFQYIYFPGHYVDGLNFRLSVADFVSNDMIPIPELDRSDGDLTIVFLSGYGVSFNEPTDDDWYRANVPYANATLYNEDGIIPLYHQQDAASPMGCVEQMQWCNLAYPKDRGCGPLAGFVDALYGAAPLFNLTEDELDLDRPASPLETGTRLLWPALILRNNPTTLATVIQFLGARSLISQTRLYNGIQFQLPKNQWQLDVTNWFNTLLASVQESFIDTILGPSDHVFDPLRWPPVNGEEEKMCDNQKIRSTAYASFSFFGLCFTFSTGVVIILLSYILEPFLKYLHKHRKYKQYTHLEWTNNTNLQLHRLANEQLEVGEWSRCTREVPTTDPGTALAYLDITDPKHPVLTRRDNRGDSGNQVEDDSSTVHSTTGIFEGPIMTDVRPGIELEIRPKTPSESGNRICSTCRMRTENGELAIRPDRSSVISVVSEHSGCICSEHHRNEAGDQMVQGRILHSDAVEESTVETTTGNINED